MSDALYDVKVTDRKSFVRFLDLLRQDLIDQPEDWGNPDLGRFLEALSAFAADIAGYYKNAHLPVDPDIPSWQVFAEMLKGAKDYE